MNTSAQITYCVCSSFNTDSIDVLVFEDKESQPTLGKEVRPTLHNIVQLYTHVHVHLTSWWF